MKNLRRLARLCLFGFSAVWFAAPTAAQTANLLVQFQSLGLQSNVVYRVTLQGLSWASTPSTFYVNPPMVINSAAYPQITNGSVVFSNQLIGVPYALTLSGYMDWTTNIFVPTNASPDGNGNINVSQYAGTYIASGIFYYSSPVFTNITINQGGGTNGGIPFASSATLSITQTNGTNYGAVLSAPMVTGSQSNLIASALQPGASVGYATNSQSAATATNAQFAAEAIADANGNTITSFYYPVSNPSNYITALTNRSGAAGQIIGGGIGTNVTLAQLPAGVVTNTQTGLILGGNWFGSATSANTAQSATTASLDDQGHTISTYYYPNSNPSGYLTNVTLFATIVTNLIITPYTYVTVSGDPAVNGNYTSNSSTVFVGPGGNKIQSEFPETSYWDIKSSSNAILYQSYDSSLVNVYATWPGRTSPYVNVTGLFTGYSTNGYTYTTNFSGTFIGDGSGLVNLQAPALTGLYYTNYTGNATNGFAITNGVVLDDDSAMTLTNDTRQLTYTNTANTFAGTFTAIGGNVVTNVQYFRHYRICPAIGGTAIPAGLGYYSSMSGDSGNGFVGNVQQQVGFTGYITNIWLHIGFVQGQLGINTNLFLYAYTNAVSVGGPVCTVFGTNQAIAYHVNSGTLAIQFLSPSNTFYFATSNSAPNTLFGPRETIEWDEVGAIQ